VHPANGQKLFRIKQVDKIQRRIKRFGGPK